MSYSNYRECWMKHIKRETKKEAFYFFQNVDNHLPSYFLSNKFQLISEFRSLSADCLPSLLDASAFGSRLASYSAGVSHISSI
jgi:hypothetical protein